MFAIYNDNTYAYFSDRRKSEIITTQKEKADESFELDQSVFVKKVCDDMISDIFEVEYSVKFFAGFEDTPAEWIVSDNEIDFDTQTVILRYARGYLPNWEIEEKNVCKREVKFSQIRQFMVSFVYSKKSGKTLKNATRETSKVSADELKELHHKYNVKNI